MNAVWVTLLWLAVLVGALVLLWRLSLRFEAAFFEDELDEE